MCSCERAPNGRAEAGLVPLALVHKRLGVVRMDVWIPRHRAKPIGGRRLALGGARLGAERLVVGLNARPLRTYAAVAERDHRLSLLLPEHLLKLRVEFLAPSAGLAASVHRRIAGV